MLSKKFKDDFKSDEEFLKHYGVLGMKWGVRKGSSSKSGSKKKGKTKKPLKEMSDDELQKKVNRLNLEKRYSQLSSAKKSKGMEYVKKTIAQFGDRALKRAANNYIDTKVDEKVNNILGKDKED